MRLQDHTRERRCTSISVSVCHAGRRIATTPHTLNARRCCAESGGAISQADRLHAVRRGTAGPGEVVEGTVIAVAISVDGMVNVVAINVGGTANVVAINVGETVIAVAIDAAARKK